ILSTFANGQQVRALSGAPAAVRAIALAPNGALAAGGTVDNHLILWNPADGKVVGQGIAHNGPVNSLAFHPVPQTAQPLTAGRHGLTKVGPLPPVPARALAHPDAALAAALSADSKRLITGGADKIVRSWNLANNQVERQFTGHAGPVTAVALSANGQLLASGG